jgi:hypothetical protein
MPGLYDLLPWYRCVVEGTSARRLTPADVAAIGGDEDLAKESLARHERFRAAAGPVRTLVGVEQPTMQSLSLANGVVEPYFFTVEERDGVVVKTDYSGDSTVFRNSAVHRAAAPSYVPQTHTALAKTDEATAFVRSVLTEGELGPPLPGATVIGLDVPDVVEVGATFDVRVTTQDDPAQAAIWLEDVETNTPLLPPLLARCPGGLRAPVRLDKPGIYRIEVKGGGYSAVGQLIMAVPASDLTEAG